MTVEITKGELARNGKLASCWFWVETLRRKASTLTAVDAQCHEYW